MDPIFAYAYDPGLYWKNHYLASQWSTDFTCGARSCTKAEMVETHRVLEQDFHASYVVIEKTRNAKLHRYLSRDPRFRKAFETGDDTLFEVRRRS